VLCEGAAAQIQGQLKKKVQDGEKPRKGWGLKKQAVNVKQIWEKKK